MTAGAGGFVDITARAKKIVFSGYFTAGAKLEVSDGAVRIVKEGRVRKLVQTVEQISFSGPRAIAQGQEIVYVTERCVLRLEPEGVTVVEIAPGRRSEARRSRRGRVPAEGRAGTEARWTRRSFIPRRSISKLRAGAGGASMSPFVELAFEGPLARLTLKRADKLNALDRAMIDALAEAAHAIEASREARVAILSGEGKAFCAGRRHRRLGRPSAARHVARLDARGASRLRGAGASARAPDRRADRPRVRRRAGARGGRRHPRRGKRDQARPARVGPRHGAGMVRNATAGAPIRAVGRAAHGAGGRDVHRGGGARARAGRRGDRERRARSGAPSNWPPTSPGAARWRCRSSRR